MVAASVTTLAASLFLAGLPGVVEAQAVQDSAAISVRIEAYLSAWNAHDASGVAALFTEDADFVMGNLPAARGRQQIRDWWQDYFTRQEPERRLTLDVGPVRFVAPDVAVITVATTTGGRDRQGQDLPARRFRGTWLWHRQSDNWLIAAMRGLPLPEDRVVLNASVEAAQALRPDIRAFVAAYEDAFNTHDPTAVSAFYKDDAEIIVRNSPLILGRQAIRDWWLAYFSELRPYRAVLIIDEIRMIAPDVALVNITATGAAPQSEGQLAPVRYARATWVIVHEAGEWLISALWILPSEDDSIVRSSGG
jgi:uncharacterized protein (TIGR02246 family)